MRHHKRMLAIMQPLFPKQLSYSYYSGMVQTSRAFCKRLFEEEVSTDKSASLLAAGPWLTSASFGELLKLAFWRFPQRLGRSDIELRLSIEGCG